MKVGCFLSFAMGLVGTSVLAEQSFTLRIGVHPEASYSATEAGGTLAIWEGNLGAKCGDLSFAGASLLTLDSNLPSEVNGGSQSVLREFARTQTSIQVVPAISACPRPVSTGQILGCARPGGPILVVKRPTLERDAQIWAHEVGHAQGLNSSFSGYISSHNPDYGTLMYRAANVANWSMTREECNQYYSAQNFPPAVAAVEEEIIIPDISNEMTNSGADADENLPMQILEADWPHGFDFTWVEILGDSLIAAAETALDEADVALWPNAVLVVGFANADGAFERVTGVLDAEITDDPETQLLFNEAKANAMLSLGYLAYHGNEGAVDILRDAMSPERVMGVMPLAEDGRPFEVIVREIARSSTVGLAIAAPSSSEAASLLQEQRIIQERGAYDIGVTDDYFESLDALSSSISAEGLQALIDP